MANHHDAACSGFGHCFPLLSTVDDRSLLVSLTPSLWPSSKEGGAKVIQNVFQQGFTLIEMMVVVAILGLMMVASSMTLRNITRSDLRSAARRTSAAMRFAFDRATMTGMYLRVAFDLDKGEIWFESSEERVTLRTGEAQHADSGGKEGSKPPVQKAVKKPMLPFFGMGKTGEEEGDDKDTDEFAGMDAKAMKDEWDADLSPVTRAKPQFQLVKSLGAKKIKLANGITIKAVMTPRLVEPTEKGKAYVYFFPQGHSEPAIIYFADRSDSFYSVVLHPLTGSAEVYPCQYKIPADFGISDDKRGRATGDPCVTRGGI